MYGVYGNINDTGKLYFNQRFLVFYFNCSARIGRPAVPQLLLVLAFSVLTQRRGGLNLLTSIKISIFLFCQTRSLFSFMVTYCFIQNNILVGTIFLLHDTNSLKLNLCTGNDLYSAKSISDRLSL